MKSQVDGFRMKLGFENLDESSFRPEIEERELRELERKRRRIEEDNALMAALRARVPDAEKRFVDASLDEDVDVIRHQVWNRVSSAIGEWPALEVTFEGQLPAPIKVVSSKKAMQIGGFRMMGNLAVGPVTVFKFNSQ